MLWLDISIETITYTLKEYYFQPSNSQGRRRCLLVCSLNNFSLGLVHGDTVGFTVDSFSLQS